MNSMEGSMPALTTESELRESLQRYNLPDYMHDGLVNYIVHHVSAGSFMMALLSNDLKGAFSRADLVNSMRMRDWVMFLYNEAPLECWGSEDRVTQWLSERQVESECERTGRQA
jgi:hypothetical protein